MAMMTRYELARVLGMRALQIEDGDPCHVAIADDRLRCNAVYAAARELEAGALDAQVDRPLTGTVHVATLRPPAELLTMLDSSDGGSRSIR